MYGSGQLPRASHYNVSVADITLFDKGSLTIYSNLTISITITCDQGRLGLSISQSSGTG